MNENRTSDKTCVVIGASHAGVNFAFALRREGWEGEIILYDSDPVLPYHRPPLSKSYLSSEESIEKNSLKSEESYTKEKITLHLGKQVFSIDSKKKKIVLADGHEQTYDKLVIATGARPIVPPINGLSMAKNLFPLRTVADVNNIRETLTEGQVKKVVVIGGGYIGLEAASSLKKLGNDVLVLEREKRILGRVTAPEMSMFFMDIHAKNGVDILAEKNVVSINTDNGFNQVVCSDGTQYLADIIIIGVGIHVNKELGEQAGLTIENGIRVDATCKTSDDDIYAIGDCTFHHNPHYGRFVRLESVQNAVDQAKVAAANICGKFTTYDSLPWFWSDQYDIKLQMVGLSTGYDELIIRRETGAHNSLSMWYFKGDSLLAVDAINNAKAYVYGTKFIKSGQKLDKSKLGDPSEEFKPTNILAK